MFLSSKLKQLFCIKIKIISLVRNTSQFLSHTVRISNFVKIKSNLNLLKVFIFFIFEVLIFSNILHLLKILNLLDIHRMSNKKIKNHLIDNISEIEILKLQL